ncbi:hypothetical protein [Flavobacterium sp. 3HN19-14]|uniref:hypothetical protein n=1 Tax=Flavobacterium sp. 3HN19-14 TaxID=3448133 RepID=UPI003EE30A59
MKANVSLRFLGVLGFLLLMAPFYDSCNGKVFTKSPVVETPQPEKTFSEKVADFFVGENALTGLEMAQFPIAMVNEGLGEFGKEISNNKATDNITILACFAFLISALLSGIIAIFTFTKNIKLVYRLSFVNSIIILVAYFDVVFFEQSFETFTQIKWGYYAFIAVQIALMVQSKRILKSAKA